MKSNEFFCGVEKTVRDNAVALLVLLHAVAASQINKFFSPY